MAYSERLKRPEIPKTEEGLEKEPSTEGKPEEKTVYGSFYGAIEELRQNIDAGSIETLDDFTRRSGFLVFYNRGELMGRFFEKRGVNTYDRMDFVKVCGGERFPSLGTVDLESFVGGKGKLERYAQDHPASMLDIFRRTHSEKLLDVVGAAAIKKFSQTFPDRALSIFAEINSDVFFELLDKQSLRADFAKNPRHVLGALNATRNRKLLELLDVSAWRQFSSADPETALMVFGGTGFEELIDWSDQEALKSWCNEYPDKASFGQLPRIDSEKYFALLDRELVKKYLETRSQLEFFATTRLEQFRDLLNKDLIRRELNTHAPRLAVSAFAMHGSGRLGVMLGIDNPDERLEELKARAVQADIEKIRSGFVENETKLRLVFAQRELADVERDLKALYESYLETAQSSMLGAELEVLNDANAEIRTLPIAFERLPQLMKFFVDFSLLSYQKFDEIKKRTPEQFPGYPHSNVHLNFGLTQEQACIARKYKKTLQDISYCHSLAYSPFSRIVYLEQKPVNNSIDYDIDKANPSLVARYQTRFFSAGGTKNEIKSSLNGISKVCALLPELFDSEEKLKRVAQALNEDAELQNRALELKWIIWQIRQIDEERDDLGSRENAAALAVLDQKNVKFRNYFSRVQEMMQIELARFA